MAELWRWKASAPQRAQGAGAAFPGCEQVLSSCRSQAPSPGAREPLLLPEQLPSLQGFQITSQASASALCWAGPGGMEHFPFWGLSPRAVQEEEIGTNPWEIFLDVNEWINRKYYFGVISRDFHCMKSGELLKECRFSTVTNVSMGLYVHVDILVYLFKGRGKVQKKEKPAQYSVVSFVFLSKLWTAFLSPWHFR